MFRIENMSFSWAGSTDLFTGIDLIVQPHESILITGDNGSGKTTLLNLLAGLLKPTQGSITWKDKEVQRQDRRFLESIFHLRQRTLDNLIGITPQHELQTWQISNPQIFTDDARNDLLCHNALQDIQDHATGTLSSGEMRRLAMAPLILLQDRIWLLDEPLSGLDTVHKEYYTTLLNKKIQESGGVIMTSHQGIKEVYGFDRIWYISNNNIKEERP